MTELLRSILLVYAAVLLVTFSFGWSRQLSMMINADKETRTITTETDSLILNLKILLADKSFHCLKQSIPSGSRSKAIIEKTAQLELSAQRRIPLHEVEARNLLLYAGHCAGVIASIWPKHSALETASSRPFVPASLLCLRLVKRDLVNQRVGGQTLPKAHINRKTLIARRKLARKMGILWIKITEHCSADALTSSPREQLYLRLF